MQSGGRLIGYDTTTGSTGGTAIWSTSTPNIAECSMLTTGNFVCYDQFGTSIWSTGTNGKGVGPNYYLAMQNDRNIVIYDSSNTRIWASNTITSRSIWSQVSVPDGVMNPILLTDGSIMVFGTMDSKVYKLTPDLFGNYKTGTVTQLASLPAGYCPLYFASATLPDGRVIIEGGEYNCGSAVWTNLGAIYDPLANVWTAVQPPSGSNNIGDASSIVLPDGTFLLQDLFHSNGVVLNATSMTWTRKQFTGKQNVIG